MATIDEAKRCPRCSNTGQEVRNDVGPKGSRIYTFNCMNTNCKWYGTGFVVQVLADGSIPDRGRVEKEFPKLTPGQEAMARRTLEDLQGRDLRDDG